MRIEHLDHLDSLHLSVTGVYEPRETALMRKVLKPGDIFVDVGAHIGYHTSVAAEAVGPDGKVYAFEPNPSNFELLEMNTDLFGGVVQAFRLAVSDRIRQAWLSLNDANTGDGRLCRMDDRQQERVYTVTLDAVPVLKDEKARMIKIDVQGSETAVLRGARELLKRSGDVIGIVEFSPVHLECCGSSGKELVDEILSQGFRIYMFNKKEGGFVMPDPKGLPNRKQRKINLIIRRRPLK